MASEANWSVTATDALSPRPWALERVAAWLNEGTAPMLLIEGDPGTGKSSLLLQFLDTLKQSSPATNVVARILRPSDYSDPYDGIQLLGSLIEGLDGGAETGEALAQSLPENLNIDVRIDQKIGEAQARANVFGVVFNLSSTTGLLPVAQRIVRSVPAHTPALIVVDALDQAEDEGADDFLQTVAAIVNAAAGTGVRVLCTTRTSLPVGFDPKLCESFDLIGDATDECSDLRAHLESQFEDLDEDERNRVVASLLSGAEANWLWATTNAAALVASLADGRALPAALTLTKGLDGLYRDGILRMERRFGRAWETDARPLVEAVACAFDGQIGETELRWVTDRNPTEIEDTVRKCEPFLHRGEDGVRLFHPDFSRWLLAGNVTGLREETGHLAIAAGLTALGHNTHWGEITERYAAPRVVDHWCAALVLDPFSPKQQENEQRLAAVLCEPNWVNRAGGILEIIEQAGSVAPTLRLPGSMLPLRSGLQAIKNSGAAQSVLGREILARLSDGEADQFDKLIESPTDDTTLQAYRWLEEHLPDLPSITSQALWGRILKGHFTIERREGTLVVGLSPDGVLDVMDEDSEEFGSQFVEMLIEEVLLEHLDALIDSFAEAAANGPSRIQFQSMLGACYRRRAKSRENETAQVEDLALAAAAFHAVVLVTDSEHKSRFDIVVDLANTLRLLPERSMDEIEMLISAQQEILAMRLDTDDPKWRHSANLLGSAYRERASRQDDEVARGVDLGLAVASYRRAAADTPPESDDRLGFLIDLAGGLLALSERSLVEIDELIDLQLEIVNIRQQEGKSDWWLSAHTLGDAYKERRSRQDDEVARGVDLGLAVASYRRAVAGMPPENEYRLNSLIDLADGLLALSERSLVEIDELIDLQLEIVNICQQEGKSDWWLSAHILGNAYRERASQRTDEVARMADTRLVLASYREAVAAMPTESEYRFGFLADLSNTLRLLSERSMDEIEMLISAQQEILAVRLDTDDPKWRYSANILGDAYRERASRQDDEVARGVDLGLAVASYRRAAADTPPESDDRLGFLIDLADGLLALSERSLVEIDELIDLQLEIVAFRQQEGGPSWWLSANLLGDAYRERAFRRTDTDEVTRDTEIRLALAPYREVVAATPVDSEYRLGSLANLADGLLALSERSLVEIDELIDLQLEMVAFRQQEGKSDWPMSAHILGNAYRERASRRADTDEATRDAEIGLALTCYHAALSATTTDYEHRVVLASATADILWSLTGRSGLQLEEIITLQAEITALNVASDDSGWIRSAVLHGDACRELANHSDYKQSPGTALDLALESYRTALAAIPEDELEYLDIAIRIANTLIELPGRTGEQVEELIAIQGQILSTRKGTGQEDWPRAASLLGQAYIERAETQEDEQARVSDFTLALDVYRDALEAVPGDSKYRLELAVATANTMLVLAAVSRSGGKDALEEGTDIVADAVAQNPADLGALRTLLPVVGAALRRQGRWHGGS